YVTKIEEAVVGKPSEPQIEIQVDGVEKEVGENIRAYLSLAQEVCTAPEWRVRRLFARSDEEIRRAVRALGYYQPEFSKRLEQEEACWKASYE
ncbi:MAG: hypothetical protein GTN88_12980, partial [Gammaproteobacteria bacterium]|nr:hypothetical protein [Gammaproteobacteria bacterium]